MKNIIEAILFATGEPISLKNIASTYEVDISIVKKAMNELINEYNDRGVNITETDGYYQMSTNPKLFDELSKYINRPQHMKLTEIQLETLSIIAYKQPVTREDVEDIRGTSCFGVINKLIEYGLVKEVGRLDTTGRAILYGTTREFLKTFGMNSKKDIDKLFGEE